MSIRLLRVDERLLHGQVVVGWGRHLELDFYLVVDASLADSEWEQELYASGLPDEVEVFFHPPDAPIARLSELFSRQGRGAVLTRGTGAMRRLAEAGLIEGRTVVIGAMHSRRGRRKVADYLYLGPEEIEDIRAMERAGAKVEARDLPSSAALSAEEMIDAAAAG